MKFLESEQQDDDRLTIRPLVSLKHVTLPKAHLTKQCKCLSKTLRHVHKYYVRKMLVHISQLEKGIHHAQPIVTLQVQ